MLSVAMSRTDKTPMPSIRPEDCTPLVEQLLGIISQLEQKVETLEAEVNRLKGLPEKPRYGKPSTLEDPDGKPSDVSRKKKKKKSRRRRPGSAKRAKTAELEIHQTVPLEIPDLPEGTERLGFKDYYVQDLKIEAHNIRYRRARYRLPDGTLVTAPLPQQIQGHFGNTLRSYVLYQHFHNQVTQPLEDYWVGAEALEYMEHFKLPRYLLERIGEGLTAGEYWVVQGRADWDSQLEYWGITSAQHRRIVTEAGLYGSLLQHELYDEMTLISDDAKQFKVLGFLNSLCWVHAERHVARLVAVTAKQRRAHEKVRDEIWTYYQQLKAYRERPRKREKARLAREFDRLFLQTTEFAELNEVLRTLHGKKGGLLLVLEHPDIPLHNNLSENDIRQYVKKRKISAGTRSALGRRCRDTFLSLKTTCRKLGVSFWQYLQDRINGLGAIAPLPQLIEDQAANA